MAKYSLFQSAVAMCMASNAVSSYDFSGDQLLTYLTRYLSEGDFDGTHFPGFFDLYNADMDGGDWRVVWGPSLTVDPSFGGSPVYARNAMYVAHSPSSSTYVVAMSGTNPDDLFDWLAEDLYVVPSALVAWPPADGGGTGATSGFQTASQAYISGGTNIGLQNLLGMKAADQTLGQFLATRASGDSALVFTGHSLGGALSPALALYLYPDPSPPTSGWRSVRVLPLAGPTAGNQQFAAAFNTAYPSTPTSDGKHLWNADYQNYHDIVPYAWNNLTSVVWIRSFLPPQLDSIYGRIGDEVGAELQTALLTAAAAVYLCNYQTINNLGFRTDWGYYQFEIVNDRYSLTPVWVPFPPLAQIDTWDQLGPLVRGAHVSQYERALEVTPPPLLPLPVAKLEAAKRKSLFTPKAGEA